MICLAVGQGIYFATDALTSFNYTEPDSNGVRHMFMGKNKVLRCLLSLINFK
jgi:hypothetical protein